MDGERNETTVHEKFGMSVKSERMNCEVVEVDKCSNINWFG